MDLCEHHEALGAADALIAKALAVDELAHAARIETLLRQYATREWERRAEEAATAVSGKTKIAQIQASVDGIMKKWAADVGPAVRAAQISIYGLGKAWVLRKTKKRPKRKAKSPTELTFDAGIDLSLEDREAIEAMVEHQLFWIGEHYDQNVSDGIAEVVKETILEAGGDRVRAGREMRTKIREALDHVTLPSGWNGTSRAYLEGLTANAATVARTQGQLKTMKSVRVERYEWVAPMDERTCPVCAHMDGKKFSVEAGARQINKINAVTEPNDVRRIHPWIRAAELTTLSPKAGDAGPKDAKRLSAVGFIMPPAHFRCRCFLDITEE